MALYGSNKERLNIVEGKGEEVIMWGRREVANGFRKKISVIILIPLSTD